MLSKSVSQLRPNTGTKFYDGLSLCKTNVKKKALVLVLESSMGPNRFLLDFRFDINLLCQSTETKNRAWVFLMNSVNKFYKSTAFTFNFYTYCIYILFYIAELNRAHMGKVLFWLSLATNDCLGISDPQCMLRYDPLAMLTESYIVLTIPTTILGTHSQLFLGLLCVHFKNFFLNALYHAKLFQGTISWVLFYVRSLRYHFLYYQLGTIFGNIT